jgi:hypothetical protein
MVRIARSLAVLVGLVFVAAVSGAYADQIGSRFHPDENFVNVEPAVIHHASLHQLPVADLGSSFTYGEDHHDWWSTGIRDGHWLRLSLRDGWKADNDGGWNDSAPPSSVATPEPGTLLLLAAGLFIVRRRVLNA